jgi:hypothetical protein
MACSTLKTHGALSFAGIKGVGFAESRRKLPFPPESSYSQPVTPELFQQLCKSHGGGGFKWIETYNPSHNPAYKQYMFPRKSGTGEEAFHGAMARTVSGIAETDPELDEKLENLAVRGGFIRAVGNKMMIDGKSGGIPTPGDQVQDVLLHLVESGILPENWKFKAIR